MDPEKPKPDTPPGAPSERTSARRRVEKLTDRREGETNRPVESDAGPASGDGDSPRLTERQRIEARERRRQSRRGRDRSIAGIKGATATDRGASGNALSRGVRATRSEVRRTAGYVLGLIVTMIERLGPAVRFVVAGLISGFAAIGRALAGTGRLVARGLTKVGAVLLSIDRIVTPRRTLFVVVVAGVGALAVSQFIDFRATEIGRAGYDPIREIANAPRTDVLNPIGSHSIALLAFAALALTGLAGLLLTGKRLFAGLIALSGVVTIAVSLLVDLPRGLDVAEAEIAYSGVAAVLLSGFWIELAAGLVLATGGAELLLISDRAGRRVSGREEMRPRGRERSRRRERSGRPADAGGLT